jgi:hypothetical protein
MADNIEFLHFVSGSKLVKACIFALSYEKTYAKKTNQVHFTLLLYTVFNFCIEPVAAQGMAYFLRLAR